MIEFFFLRFETLLPFNVRWSLDKDYAGNTADSSLVGRELLRSGQSNT